jgi:hypothetical protein
VQEEHRDQVLHLPNRGVYIEIPNVRTYSQGLYDDGSNAFWAAGQAGWYEIIEPHKNYRAKYDGMVTAVSLMTFLTERYTVGKLSKGRRSLPGTVDDVWENVSANVPSTVQPRRWLMLPTTSTRNSMTPARPLVTLLSSSTLIESS